MTFELIDFRILFRALRMEVSEEEFSWQRVLKQYRLFSARASQRRQLRHLSDHQLKDIGISRSEAIQEAQKAFWQE